VGAVAAEWWKARVNLNAKTPAFAAAIPALTHDELAGWGQGGDVTRQTMSLVLLRHAGEGPHAAGLFDAVRAATDEVMADVLEVRGEGDDDLSRFFDLALVGELVSLHLAGHEGVDPGPVPAVDEAQAAVLPSL
jgi:glucose/mannose-6-phosphate isomerase